MAARTSRGDAWKGVGEAWALMGTLTAGVLAWGGIGVLVDLWLGFHWLFLPVGMVLGMAGSIYLVYVRFGRYDGTS